MKIKFYEPTSQNQGKNAAHAQYIGTRSGADRTDTLNELNDDLDIQFDTPEAHAKYANERPGSHGLFGQDSTNKPVMKDIQKELKNHEGLVWRLILSLREDDAIRLGYTNKRQWERMLRATVIDAANKMKIKPTNLRWVAAFHEEKGHPHVHLMMWEKDPKRTRGVLSKGEYEDVKRVFVNEIYAEERTRIYQERTAVRDYIRDFSKDEVSDSVKLLRDLDYSRKDIKLELQSLGQVAGSISPRLHDQENHELALKLYELSGSIPKKGRLALGYMPEDIRNEILEVSEWLLKQPQFHSLVDKYLGYSEELAKHYSFKESDILKARENAYKDIQRRIGQLVLKGAVEAKKHVHFQLNETAIKKMEPVLYNAITDNSLSIERLNKDLQTFSRILTVSGYEKDESIKILKKWVERSNLSYNHEALEKAIEKAQAFREERQLWGKDIIIHPKEWERFFRDIGVNDNQKTPKWIWSQQKGQVAPKTVAHSVVKGAWRSLEREQQKAEAKAMIERRKQAQEAQLTPEQKKQKRAKHRQFQNEEEYEG